MNFVYGLFSTFHDIFYGVRDGIKGAIYGSQSSSKFIGPPAPPAKGGTSISGVIGIVVISFIGFKIIRKIFK